MRDINRGAFALEKVGIEKTAHVESTESLQSPWILALI
jgi:hypothetical protein